jgi:hypothetical protein
LRFSVHGGLLAAGSSEKKHVRTLISIQEALEFVFLALGIKTPGKEAATAATGCFCQKVVRIGNWNQLIPSRRQVKLTIALFVSLYKQKKNSNARSNY